MIFGLNFGLQAGEALVSPFNGGMFTNGGFEKGLDGWLESSDWTATVDADTAENPATGTNQVLFQNFTLLDGEYYAISAQYLSGDATINYIINDVDSGIDINGGVHLFLGDGVARSIGTGIINVGTVKSVVDSMRLVHVPNPVIDFTASPDPLLIQYVPV